MSNQLKVKATFEAQHLDVGLSTEVPIRYGDVIEKYQLVEARASLTHVQGSFSVELGATTDELRLPWDADRLHCVLLVTQLPNEALAEARSELEELKTHYLDIAQANKSLPPPRTPELVAAKVLGGE